MRNILITVAYDGTNFHGYQDQGPKKLRTVETLLKAALEKTVGHDVALQSAGRTDKGVHALGQKANFLSDTPIDLGNFPRVVNYHLPRDLSIVEAVEVPADFHARYGAKKKHYKYRIYNTKHRNGMLDRFAVHAPFPLDVERMARALKQIEGFHDFSAFIGRYASPANPKRAIDEITVTRSGEIIEVDFFGKSFLKNQIRIIMGCAMEIGRGLMPEDQLLKATKTLDRKDLGPTAAANGLILMSIDYE
ncbi:tRNA pseudouridine(38-40) synthase TruA [Aedoeadaptatus acetigenes]|uniref:tRNA pseudouridine(38-40) synthase TruA n=1 Tax=Aedoeadaptatus acetigenes TaxID=2981723 RepID=UPI0011DD74BB|nr:tRNA pseudouridine(38-40) synthase TruA [Aedoeadaptatus acetigenes]MCU6786578.1 tRNA pseudouridine(38-40) synthase TruA [Aedoeadaptatus acetigenes]